jgi:D-alanine-D-alanine ligase
LSYEDKYLTGNKGTKGSKGAGMASLSRKIPAPISKKLTQEIQNATVKVFKALEGCGVARIDFFVDPKSEKFWINEVNSPPGSLAFYLYEPMGISYKEELDIMIEAALERFKDQSKTQFTFDSPLLEQMAKAGGLKR